MPGGGSGRESCGTVPELLAIGGDPIPLAEDGPPLSNTVAPPVAAKPGCEVPVPPPEDGPPVGDPVAPFTPTGLSPIYVPANPPKVGM